MNKRSVFCFANLLRLSRDPLTVRAFFISPNQVPTRLSDALRVIFATEVAAAALGTDDMEVVAWHPPCLDTSDADGSCSAGSGGSGSEDDGLSFVGSGGVRPGDYDPRQFPYAARVGCDARL